MGEESVRKCGGVVDGVVWWVRGEGRKGGRGFNTSITEINIFMINITKHN